MKKRSPCPLALVPECLVPDLVRECPRVPVLLLKEARTRSPCPLVPDPECLHALALLVLAWLLARVLRARALLPKERKSRPGRPCLLGPVLVLECLLDRGLLARDRKRLALRVRDQACLLALVPEWLVPA